MVTHDELMPTRASLLNSAPFRSSDDTATAPTVERVPDPAGADLASIWNGEWEQHLLQAALARIKRMVHPEHYEIYHLHVILGQPARAVARALDVNVAQIYLAKHRVGTLLKQELKKLAQGS